ncbi:MAG TPA: lipoyl synthase [Gammaproteobacteria bacterium]|nr:lipoyl synthase [Gammaproteobacteria bacterium]
MNNLIPMKVIKENGTVAIKNGIKANLNRNIPNLRKPTWLRVKYSDTKKYREVKSIVHERNLHTVCEEAMCPNISECWSHGTATFMLLGSICTRACKFCAVDTGNPKGNVDVKEPDKVADSISLMGLKYVVLTSVNRDDLDDGGADHYAKTVEAVKRKTPEVIVEALVPDFLGVESSIERLLDSGVEVFAQNIETVKRLTSRVRDPRAGYEQTLDVLRYAKEYRNNIVTKTSLMLGLGETNEEVIDSLQDIKDNQVDILTLGQYLRPTINHLPIKKWYSPKEFNTYKEIALEIGFLEVASGPMVRSSYRADKIAYLFNNK